MPPLYYPICSTDDELRQILALQAANASDIVADTNKATDGFVTVRHDFDLLKAMNSPYAHQLAKDGPKVAGYALVMCREFGYSIPVLRPMFSQIDRLIFDGLPISSAYSYFIMGQICIDAAYRRQGVFGELYRHLRQRMLPHFDLMITEVSRRNTRSLAAHLHNGFVIAHEYTADGEDWVIVISDLRSTSV